MSARLTEVITEVLVEETELNVTAMYRRVDDRLYVAYDPDKLTRHQLDAMLLMFVDGYFEYLQAQTAAATAGGAR